MIGQNSYSDTNTNFNNGFNPDADSIPEQPVVSETPTPPAPTKKKTINKKMLGIVVGGVILVSLVVAAFLIFFKKPAEEPTPSEPTATITENNKLSISGDKTDQEIIDQFNDAISSATTAEETMNATFSKISFEVMSGEFEAALVELDKIDASSLSDYDQYRLHNYYVTTYKGLGNADEATRHQTLSDEAHARDLASFTLE